MGRKAALSLLLVSIGVGCAVGEARHRRFAHELVVPKPSSVAADGFFRAILLEQRTVDAMREHVATAGDRLLAVVKIPRGIPYTVYSFVGTGDGIRIVVTHMSLGTLQAKAIGEGSASQLEELFEIASRDLVCTSGSIQKPLYGVVLIHWPSTTQEVCVGDDLSYEALPFVKRLVPILMSAREVYSDPEWPVFVED